MFFVSPTPSSSTKLLRWWCTLSLCVACNVDKTAFESPTSTSDPLGALPFSLLQQAKIRIGPRSAAASQEWIRRQGIIENHNRLHLAIPLQVTNERRVFVFERDTSSPHEQPHSEMQPVLRLDVQTLSQRRLTFDFDRASWSEVHELERDEPLFRFEISSRNLEPEYSESSDRDLKIRCSARMIYRQIMDFSHYPLQEETIKIKDLWTSNVDSPSRLLTNSTDFESISQQF